MSLGPRCRPAAGDATVIFDGIGANYLVNGPTA
jgi:hypothetical protein